MGPPPFVPVHRKFEVVTTRQLSHPLPVPAAKAGCPIQAVLWLEWDKQHSTSGGFSAACWIETLLVGVFKRELSQLERARDGGLVILHAGDGVRLGCIGREAPDFSRAQVHDYLPMDLFAAIGRPQHLGA